MLLAACTAGVPTDPQRGASAGSDALAQVGRWKLQGAEDGQGMPVSALLPDGSAVHALVFANGRVTVEGGCNHMGGRYRMDRSGRLVVSEIQSTLMACSDQDLMTADSAVSALLEGRSDPSIAESYPEQLFLLHEDGARSYWVAVRPAP
ncbi:MAG: META domain-containing protein [Pseudomonadota bacterium]|nr:META domain-containing protein [Pseudomonadota bacterium]